MRLALRLWMVGLGLGLASGAAAWGQASAVPSAQVSAAEGKSGRELLEAMVASRMRGLRSLRSMGG